MSFRHDYLSGTSKIVRESSLAIMISVATDLGAGIFLGINSHLFLIFPGLIVLIPAAIGMRGNIFAAMGSRMGSAMHLGSLAKFEWKNIIVRNNVYSTFTLTVVFSVFLGVAAKAMMAIFNIPSMSLSSMVLVSFLAGIISGVFLLFLTFFIAFMSYKKGWDPDNVTSPLITGLGDLFTMPALIFSGYFILSVQDHLLVLDMIVLAIFLVTVGLTAAAFMRHKEEKFISKESNYKSIIFQTSAILFLTTLINIIGGIVIQSNIEKIVTVPIIFMFIPVFLEEGGNIGNILASRLSTKLHLGYVKARFRLSIFVKREFVSSYILTLIVFPAVGVITFFAGSLFGITGLGIAEMIIISTIASLMLVTVISVISFSISIMSYRYGLDPDNTTIPLVTSIADVVGIFALIITLILLGIV